MSNEITVEDAEARARAAGVQILDFDPECDPAFRDDPLGTMLAARRAGDIFYSTAARGFWVVTSYPLCREIGTDTDNFSNRETFTFYRKPSPGIHIPPNLDPPEHTKIRRMLAPLLSPSAVKKLEPAARESVRRLADEVVARGHCDFMADVALRVPADVFLEHMGLPVEHTDDIVATRLLAGELNASNDPDGSRLAAATTKINQMFVEVIAERRRRPADDIPSYLLAQEIDGKPLTDKEILTMCYTLLGTSLGTTASTMAMLVAHLAHEPGLRRSITTDPDMVGGLIEEALRYFPSIPLLPRTVRADIDFHGLPWKEGDRLVLLLPTANTDPGVFDEASTFDADRRPNRHIGFGLGPHTCAGSHLARMELRALVEEWHAKVPDYRVGDLSEVKHELSVAIRMTTLPFVVGSSVN
ncbi:cytochrome P450 [Nocardia flavorosea]|uniref:Cytochrome P450 n=1 Tax=Nocardia flavorosea TaxID=53429 RepID=A0A846YP06_9NOCA|nr:cytochrome P450 [Nocardia flavorosea]NKY60513.1 cytochrome P450 [Nocardia flavorosea]